MSVLTGINNIPGQHFIYPSDLITSHLKQLLYRRVQQAKYFLSSTAATIEACGETGLERKESPHRSASLVLTGDFV